ncbi:MAG: hypothetical protein ACRDX8_10080 [Acidimicrobiales bacterium]
MGAAESVSSWVNEALRAQVERDHKLLALAEAVADYEAEHGEISAEEMAEQARRNGSFGSASNGGAQRGVA